MKLFAGIFYLYFTALYANAAQKTPFIIAVAGGSASGKTYTARKLVEALGPERTTLLSMDNYYAPHAQPEKFYRNGSINYDHPSAVNLGKLARHLQYLKAGFPVRVKEYTYERVGEPEVWFDIVPKEFVVVEGIFALYPEIRQWADFGIFVDVDVTTRYARRLARDQKERGLSADQVRLMFEATVEPMHQKYVQPTGLWANIIVDSPDDADRVATLIASMKNLAAKTRQSKVEILNQNYQHTLRILMSAEPKDASLQIVRFADLYATQEDIGFLHISHKSNEVDELMRRAVESFDDPSLLRNYLAANPIPVVFREGKYFAVDHHHLLLALHLKGISEFYVKVIDLPSDFDPTRRVYIEDPSHYISLDTLRNNSYRSLIAIIRDQGHLQKTGRPHEEFAWARTLEEQFLKEGIVLSDDLLMDPLTREGILNRAIKIFTEPKTSCEQSAIPGHPGE